MKLSKPIRTARRRELELRTLPKSVEMVSGSQVLFAMSSNFSIKVKKKKKWSGISAKEEVQVWKWSMQIWEENQGSSLPGKHCCLHVALADVNRDRALCYLRETCRTWFIGTISLPNCRSKWGVTGHEEETVKPTAACCPLDALDVEVELFSSGYKHPKN